MTLVRRPDAEVHFEVRRGTGPPVVALHGLSGNSDYWLASGFSAGVAGRVQLVVIDLRGHGRTEVRSAEGAAFEADAMAMDVEAVADELGFDRFHLLGHATGSLVALTCALRAPSRVLSAVLTNTVLPDTDVDRRWAVMDEAAALLERSDWDLLVRAMRASPGPFLAGIDQHRDRERLWQRYEAMVRRGEPQLQAAFLRSFFRGSLPTLGDAAAITCPTVVIDGQRDRVALRSGAALASAVGGAAHVVLDGVGHQSAFEDPDHLADVVVRSTAGAT